MPTTKTPLEELLARNASLRFTDTDFDEMCRDHAILEADLSKLMDASSPRETPAQDDIRNSLSGLETEIREKIAKANRPTK